MPDTEIVGEWCPKCNFSLIYIKGLYCRGTTSSVSVTSSPSLASRVEPQHDKSVATYLNTATGLTAVVAGVGFAEGEPTAAGTGVPTVMW